MSKTTENLREKIRKSILIQADIYNRRTLEPEETLDVLESLIQAELASARREEKLELLKRLFKAWDMEDKPAGSWVEHTFKIEFDKLGISKDYFIDSLRQTPKQGTEDMEERGDNSGKHETVLDDDLD